MSAKSTEKSQNFISIKNTDQKRIFEINQPQYCLSLSLACFIIFLYYFRQIIKQIMIYSRMLDRQSPQLHKRYIKTQQQQYIYKEQFPKIKPHYYRPLQTQTRRLQLVPADFQHQPKRRIKSLASESPYDKWKNSYIQRDVENLKDEIKKITKSLSRKKYLRNANEDEYGENIYRKIENQKIYLRRKDLANQQQSSQYQNQKKIYRLRNIRDYPNFKNKYFYPKQTNYLKPQSPILVLEDDNSDDQSILNYSVKRIRRGGRRRNHKEFMYEYVYVPRSQRRKGRFNKHFRKAVHAVLFMIYLRKYNYRMQINRKVSFYNYVKENLKDKLHEMKKMFVQRSKKFFGILKNQYKQKELLLREKDSLRTRRQKILMTKGLVSLQIDSLEEIIRQVTSSFYLAQTIYYLCKYGSYACSQPINTREQLNILCISQKFGYIRADKHLQRSAIISLVFIKILLFNILLQPQKLEQIVEQRYLVNFRNNIRLVGNIIYQLCIEIQDNEIQKPPPGYEIGNWVSLKNKFMFKPVQSMTIRAGVHLKNQIISGLIDHKYVKETYSTNTMIYQKRILEEIVKLIHQNIVRHHENLREKHFIR